MNTRILLSSFALTALPALAGPPPQAPSAPAPKESGWQFTAGPYLWTQGLEGTTGVRGLALDIDVPFSDIFDVLDFSFMGVFEARKGRWSILTDINYTELSPSATTRDVLFSSAEMKMKQFLGNVALNYQVVATEQTSVSLYAGTRINGLDVSASLNRVDGGIVSESGDEYWYDAIVGVRLRQHLSGPWYFRLTGDIGAGDSDSTWQLAGLFEYRLKENISLGLGYRWLDTDYANGGFTYDVQASGLVLGAEFRW
jgi:opacity protein-like surface antigen